MNTLSPLIRRRAEWISVVCGTAGGMLANIERSNAMVLWIVAASAFAGAVGNVSADAGDDPGLRPRAGIRAGVLTAVIAGAVAVVGFTIQGFIGGFLVIVPALLAIPPGAFFGLLGSLAVSMLQNPKVRPLGETNATKRSRPSILLVAIILGSIAGYLSPFIALLLPTLVPKPAPSPNPVVVATPTPVPKPTLTFVERREPPKPPPWKYEAPTGFADARPSQLKVMRAVSLGAYESPLRYAFAKDGHTFAFLRSNSTIAVLDTNEPETVFTFTVPETPKDFEFSPDGQRLFCLTINDGKFVVSRDRAIRLPLPKGALSGTIDWTESSRVFVGDRVLDLETLQLSPASKDRIPTKRASHPHIALRTAGRLTAVHDSRLESEKRHVLADASRDYFIVTPARGELAFLSPDGTKLFDAGNRELAVMYFELRSSREVIFSVNMGSPPPASVADAIRTRKLFAAVCPLIINPLNDKPVAADLSRVKAVVGVRSWENETASFYVREDYQMTVENGDAVGLLLNSESGRHSVVRGFENWWSTVRDVTPGDAPDAITQSEPKPPQTVGPPKPSEPLVKPQRPEVPDRMAELLRSFVMSHHAKSTRGDVEGLVADYADRVDHLKGSVVDRETIRQEELAYHSPGTRVSETVVGDIKISAAGEYLYRANYTIRYEQIRPNGAWARGLSDIDLVIDVGRASPRVIPQIVRQRANNRDKQKGP